MNYPNRENRLYLYILLLIAKLKKNRALIREILARQEGEREGEETEEKEEEEDPLITKAKRLILDCFNIIERAVISRGTSTDPDFIRFIGLKDEILSFNKTEEFEKIINLLIKFLRKISGLPDP